jgi:uncharacterized protein (DUF983 family)
LAAAGAQATAAVAFRGKLRCAPQRIDCAAARPYLDVMSDHPLKTDLWNGLRGKCPACGKGHMFRAFLKVADQCEVCGEELHHQRADDFPAYLVIVIVGHLVVPLILHVEMAYEPAYWIHAVLWLPLTLFLTLVLIQPVKGAVIAMQWRVGMHGFEASKKLRETGAAPAQV